MQKRAYNFKIFSACCLFLLCIIFSTVHMIPVSNIITVMLLLISCSVAHVSCVCRVCFGINEIKKKINNAFTYTVVWHRKIWQKKGKKKRRQLILLLSKQNHTFSWLLFGWREQNARGGGGGLCDTTAHHRLFILLNIRREYSPSPVAPRFQSPL